MTQELKGEEMKCKCGKTLTMATLGGKDNKQELCHGCWMKTYPPGSPAWKYCGCSACDREYTRRTGNRAAFM
jgi:hypothetical protein